MSSARIPQEYCLYYHSILKTLTLESKDLSHQIKKQPCSPVTGYSRQLSIINKRVPNRLFKIELPQFYFFKFSQPNHHTPLTPFSGQSKDAPNRIGCCSFRCLCRSARTRGKGFVLSRVLPVRGLRTGRIGWGCFCGFLTRGRRLRRGDGCPSKVPSPHPLPNNHP